MYILDNSSFEIQKNFHEVPEQMSRASICKKIKIWFQWLTNVIRVWKCEFSRYILGNISFETQ